MICFRNRNREYSAPGRSTTGDPDGSLLVDYQSENASLQSDIVNDPQVSRQLEVLRGQSETETGVMKASGLATRKDYEIHVGVGSDERDAFFDGGHEI
jgi:hypothetical protein